MFPSRNTRRRSLTLALALAFGGSWVAAAQTFGEDVSVTVVEVPVQVVRGGKPVRGLTAEDFVLFDRGERQEVIGFEVVDALAARGAPADAAQTPPGRQLEASSEAPPAGRHLLLFFDFQFASRVRIERAVRGARKMVAQDLGPGDRVAVAIYAGRTGANILTGFTGDSGDIELGLAYIEAIARGRLEELVAARERLVEYWVGASGSPQRDGNEERLRSLARRLGSSAAVALAGFELTGDVMSLADYDRISGVGAGRAGPDGGALDRLVGPRLIDETSPALEDMLSQILRFSESVADLVTLLRDVPQPKHLLYFSQGFPTWVFTNPAVQGRAIERIRRGLRVVQDSGWVFQAIDVEGIPDTLAASGRSATEFEDPGMTTFIAGAPRGQLVPPTGGSAFDAEALAYLASETGGFVAENFNDLALAGQRILRATEVTYLLAFQPPDLVADGSFHRLEVKLASPKRRTRVIHRTAYRAPPPPGLREEAERRMDQARLITGDEPVADLAARSMVLPGSRTRFVIELTRSELAVGTTDEVMELDFQAYLFDAGGVVEDVLSRRLTLDLAEVGARLDRGGLRLAAAFEDSPDAHRVRLILEEVKTGRVFAHSHRIEPRGEGSRWALPPVFFEPAEETLFLEVRPAAWDRLGFPADRYAPAVRKTVESGGRRAILFTYRAAVGESPTVSARISRATGGAVAGGAIVWKRRFAAEDGSTRLIGELDAGGLAPGEYRLELSVAAGEGGQPVVASDVFTVGP